IYSHTLSLHDALPISLAVADNPLRRPHPLGIPFSPANEGDSLQGRGGIGVKKPVPNGGQRFLPAFCFLKREDPFQAVRPVQSQRSEEHTSELQSRENI